MDLRDKIPGASNFVWGDSLWLSKWKIHCFPTSKEADEIIKIAYKLQQIRNFFGKPINVTSWLRPPVYNELIGGSKNSAHMSGMAVDFRVEGLDCDEVRIRLLDHIENLKIRMEDLPGASWVHIDHIVPGPKGNRFFKP